VRSEALVRFNVVTWAKARGIKHLRLAMRPGVRAGIPDDLFTLPMQATKLPFAVSLYIEFKRVGKQPTDLQRARIGELQDAGAFADWFDNEASAVAFIRGALDALRLYAESGRVFDRALLGRPAAAAGRSQDVDCTRGLPPLALKRPGGDDVGHSAFEGSAADVAGRVRKVVRLSAYERRRAARIEKRKSS
jgi:hypothetical protein